MSLKIVSFSKTKLAGAPIRVAQAVGRLEGFETRHVDLERWGVFPHDHVHAESAEETLRLTQEADILHLHNHVHLDSADFAPINFRQLWEQGKPIVWHFHSTPMLVARQTGLPLKTFVEPEIPQIVIAQYPERFLPRAQVVPNLVPQDDADYQGLPFEQCRYDISYAPSSKNSAWSTRWDTKGMPETVAMLRQLEQKDGTRVKVTHNVSLAEVLAAKRQSKIVLDEMVTGSYHISALEGLAMARATGGYLDARTDYVMRTISGAPDLPFINLRLEESKRILRYLLAHPKELQDIASYGREWMDRYWRDLTVAEHFRRLYHQLLDDPTRVQRQEEFALDRPSRRFVAHGMADAIYESRKAAAWTPIHRFKRKAKRLLRRLIPRSS